MRKEIVCDAIEIKGPITRHEIVKKVVTKFIKTEYSQKGKGITFRYPVEHLPTNKDLCIVRPGHKKNFDFKVEITDEMILEEGKHHQIALDLRRKRQDNERKFGDFFLAVEKVYHCLENDVDELLAKSPSLRKRFQSGAEVEVLLKVLKWLFIMEDIVYWDVEGRAFLYNYLLYVANENDENRLAEAMVKVKNPDRLKSFMKKAGMEWVPYQD